MCICKNYINKNGLLPQTWKIEYQFSSVQSFSCVQLFVTPWIAAHQASVSVTNSWSRTKPISIKSVMPSSRLILCRPLFILPPIPPSIRVFSNESALHIRWPKYWHFSLSISPSNEYSGLMSFRMDWLDLLSVQGTLKSRLQHHSSKASILRCSAFFTVQLSHPYMTTGKTIALTRWTFVGKVISLLFFFPVFLLIFKFYLIFKLYIIVLVLPNIKMNPPQVYMLFNMLSRLVITFLPRSKRLLISWLQPASAVILEPPKIKSDTVSTVSIHWEWM